MLKYKCKQCGGQPEFVNVPARGGHGSCPPAWYLRCGCGMRTDAVQQCGNEYECKAACALIWHGKEQ